jgi:hypothetical protein
VTMWYRRNVSMTSRTSQSGITTGIPPLTAHLPITQDSETFSLYLGQTNKVPLRYSLYAKRVADTPRT